MIKTCILLYALIINNLGLGIEPQKDDLLDFANCLNNLYPKRKGKGG